jgi:Zn-dependent membrane protease YugP
MLPILFIFFAIVAVSVYGQVRVSGAIGAYGGVGVDAGTGAEVARKVLEQAGVEGVEVVERDVLLSDYYDAVRRKLVLSKTTFGESNAAAVGIAVHEVGHAIQQHQGNGKMLAKRLSAIRMSHLVGGLVFWVPVLLCLFRAIPVKAGIMLVVLGWAVLIFYGMMTMTVELDASKKGLRAIEGARVLKSVKEREAVEAIVAASAWQRSADVLRSPQLILYYLLPFLGWKK